MKIIYDETYNKIIQIIIYKKGKIKIRIYKLGVRKEEWEL